jgi:hypothetical protein
MYRVTTSRTGLLRLAAAAAVLAGVCAGSAWAQVRVSGIEHTPIGGATFDPPVERSLTVRNLGNGGLDGVEIRCNSRWGGAVRIDMDEMLIPSPAAREIRVRPKGWDGTVKGSVRMSSVPPDGTPGAMLDLDCDLSALAASTVRVRCRDAAGDTQAERVVSGSSVQCVLHVAPQGLTIPSVQVAIRTKGTGADPNRVIVVSFDGMTCDVSGLEPAMLHEVRSIEFEAETCGACDSWLGTESLLVTAGGVSRCVVSDATIGTFGVSSHAVGAAHVDELCADPGDCDNVRRVQVSNLGDAGQDGIEIRLDQSGDTAFNGASLHVAAGNRHRGFVTLMKAFDDEDGEAMRVSQSSDGDGASHTMEFDWSARPGGPHAATVTILDAGDQVLASYAASGSGSITYIGPCDASRPRSVRCEGDEYELELCDGPVTVFAQGMPVPNSRKVKVSIETLTSRTARTLVVTGNPTDYLEISGVELIELPPACAADFDGNGVREVSDIFAFLSAWFAGNPAAFNFGGTPGVPAIFAFLSAWFAGC